MVQAKTTMPTNKRKNSQTASDPPQTRSKILKSLDDSYVPLTKEDESNELHASIEDNSGSDQVVSHPRESVEYDIAGVTWYV